jgi:hypothetical protein
MYNLTPFFKDVYANNVTMNFIENSDAPIYLPIGTLIEKAESQHLLKRGYHIYITDTTGYHNSLVHKIAILQHYKRIAHSYSIELDKLFKCRCDSTADAIMVPFIYFSGMNSGLRESSPKFSPFVALPQKMSESWFAANQKKDQCHKEMKKTCGSVVTETFNGDLIGLLGISKSH